MKPEKAELQKENMLQLLLLDNIEAAKLLLEAEGLNSEEEGKKGALFIQKLLRDRRINAAKSRVSLWEKAKQLLQKKIDSGRGFSLENTVQGFPQLQGVFNRNLAEIDPDDIAEILTEQQLLELIEELKGEKDKPE